jgi:hypothetical protein
MGICNRYASQQGAERCRQPPAIVVKSLVVRTSCCPIEQLPIASAKKISVSAASLGRFALLRHGLNYCRIGPFLRAGDLSAPVPIMILADPRLADGGIAPLRCHTFTNSSTDESAFPHVSNDYF